MKIKTKTVVLIGIAACVLLLTSPALGMGEIKVREFEDLKVWQIGKVLSGLINSLRNIHIILKLKRKTEVTKYGRNNKLE